MIIEIYKINTSKACHKIYGNTLKNLFINVFGHIKDMIFSNAYNTNVRNEIMDQFVKL